MANFKEIDPELGALNLSKGGDYPIEYALRLGAGFGSQISMSLMRWVKPKDGAHRKANELGYGYRIVDRAAWDAWLTRMAGRPAADLEVVNRTLRVKDQGLSARVAEVAKEVQAATTAAPVVQVPAATKVPTVVATKSEAVAPVVVTKPTPPPVEKKPVEVKAQVPATAVVPATQPKDAFAGDSVKDRVLALVAEKTGYPIDMLDLDLDLEADLGVDTVKQAEVFATIREAYGIARDDQIKLREYPTLAHVIRFVNERRPDVAVAAQAAVATTTEEVATKVVPAVDATIASLAITGDAVKERILDLAVEKTGYPRDMLDLDLDLEADLGVDTVKQAEMFAAIREIYNIPRDENRKLRDYPTLAHVIKFVYDSRPDLAQATALAPAAVEPVAKPEAAVAEVKIPTAPVPAVEQFG